MIPLRSSLWSWLFPGLTGPFGFARDHHGDGHILPPALCLYGEGGGRLREDWGGPKAPEGVLLGFVFDNYRSGRIRGGNQVGLND
jgi:hypothetical protein